MTKRKKSSRTTSTTPSAEPSASKTSNDDTLQALEGKPTNAAEQSIEQSTEQQTPSTPRPQENRTSWVGGSWRGKATAVAEIARESIPGSTSFDKSTPNRVVRDTSQRLSQGLNALGKASPSVAAATRLNVTSGASEDDEPAAEAKPATDPPEKDAEAKNATNAGEVAAEGTPETTLKDRPTPAAGWRGWWSRREEISDAGKSEPVETVSNAAESKKPDNELPTSGEADTPSRGKKAAALNPSEQEVLPAQQSTINAEAKPQPQRTSWFGLLGSGSNAGVLEYQSLPTSSSKAEAAQPSASTAPATTETPEPSMSKPSEQPAPSNPTSASWAFWSREPPKADGTAGSEPSGKSQMGELAVSGTDSQSKPMAALIGQDVKAAAAAVSKRVDPTSTAEKSPAKKTAKPKDALQDAAKSEEASSESEVPASMQDSILKTRVEAPKKAKRQSHKTQQNIVLPEFEDTYRRANGPSYWSKISWVWGRGQAQQPTHLSISSSPHRPRRALAIGIHGLVPTPMIQKILGPPTGTSIRFADGAAEAIRKITQARGYSCDIEKVALEGEGLIADRIDSLWKLLLNWIDQIRKADFVFIACHSQGVPVAVSIVARLLNFGCVGGSTRLGICGMAGTNLGPFPSYQSRFLGSSATELFSFSQPSSPVSQSYASALSLILRNHVRILYIGSIDDQLVSMESAIYSNAQHQYIYRAVFVDGRLHAPDFLTHLVGFALKLRNLGLSDHGLIRELSSPLAGSLYTGEGHSRIYEDAAVYELAVRHALDTESMDGAANPALDVRPYEVPSTTGANPYFLPWAMRGILEEEVVRNELKGETEELLGMFEKWRPSSKVLKDVRFRLEAVRSKL